MGDEFFCQRAGHWVSASDQEQGPADGDLHSKVMESNPQAGGQLPCSEDLQFAAQLLGISLGAAEVLAQRNLQQKGLQGTTDAAGGTGSGRERPVAAGGTGSGRERPVASTSGSNGSTHPGSSLKDAASRDRSRGRRSRSVTPPKVKVERGDGSSKQGRSSRDGSQQSASPSGSKQGKVRKDRSRSGSKENNRSDKSKTRPKRSRSRSTSQSRSKPSRARKSKSKSPAKVRSKSPQNRQQRSRSRSSSAEKSGKKEKKKSKKSSSKSPKKKKKKSGHSPAKKSKSSKRSPSSSPVGRRPSSNPGRKQGAASPEKRLKSPSNRSPLKAKSDKPSASKSPVRRKDSNVSLQRLSKDKSPRRTSSNERSKTHRSHSPSAKPSQSSKSASRRSRSRSGSRDRSRKSWSPKHNFRRSHSRSPRRHRSRSLERGDRGCRRPFRGRGRGYFRRGTTYRIQRSRSPRKSPTFKRKRSLSKSPRRSPIRTSHRSKRSLSKSPMRRSLSRSLSHSPLRRSRSRSRTPQNRSQAWRRRSLSPRRGFRRSFSRSLSRDSRRSRSMSRDSFSPSQRFERSRSLNTLRKRLKIFSKDDDLSSESSYYSPRRSKERFRSRSFSGSDYSRSDSYSSDGIGWGSPVFINSRFSSRSLSRSRSRSRSPSFPRFRSRSRSPDTRRRSRTPDLRRRSRSHSRDQFGRMLRPCSRSRSLSRDRGRPRQRIFTRGRSRSSSRGRVGQRSRSKSQSPFRRQRHSSSGNHGNRFRRSPSRSPVRKMVLSNKSGRKSRSRSPGRKMILPSKSGRKSRSRSPGYTQRASTTQKSVQSTEDANVKSSDIAKGIKSIRQNAETATTNDGGGNKAIADSHQGGSSKEQTGEPPGGGAGTSGGEGQKKTTQEKLLETLKRLQELEAQQKAQDDELQKFKDTLLKKRKMKESQDSVPLKIKKEQSEAEVVETTKQSSPGSSSEDKMREKSGQDTTGKMRNNAGQELDPTGQTASAVGQRPDMTGQMSGQTGQVSGQTGQVLGQTGQMSGQAGHVLGQTGQVSGQTGQMSAQGMYFQPSVGQWVMQPGGMVVWQPYNQPYQQSMYMQQNDMTHWQPGQATDQPNQTDQNIGKPVGMYYHPGTGQWQQVQSEMVSGEGQSEAGGSQSTDYPPLPPSEGPKEQPPPPDSTPPPPPSSEHTPPRDQVSPQKTKKGGSQHQFPLVLPQEPSGTRSSSQRQHEGKMQKKHLTASDHQEDDLASDTRGIRKGKDHSESAVSSTDKQQHAGTSSSSATKSPKLAGLSASRNESVPKRKQDLASGLKGSEVRGQKVPEVRGQTSSNDKSEYQKVPEQRTAQNQKSLKQSSTKSHVKQSYQTSEQKSLGKQKSPYQDQQDHISAASQKIPDRTRSSSRDKEQEHLPKHNRSSSGMIPSGSVSTGGKHTRQSSETRSGSGQVEIKREKEEESKKNKDHHDNKSGKHSREKQQDSTKSDKQSETGARIKREPSSERSSHSGEKRMRLDSSSSRRSVTSNESGHGEDSHHEVKRPVDNTLFVFGLTRDITRKDMFDYFQHFGQIDTITVPRGNYQQKYCFIKFLTKGAVECVMKEGRVLMSGHGRKVQHCIRGWYLVCEIAGGKRNDEFTARVEKEEPAEKPSHKRHPSPRREKPKEETAKVEKELDKEEEKHFIVSQDFVENKLDDDGPEKLTSNNRIHVSRLGKDVSNGHLIKHFGRYGHISQLKRPSMGFAFITFRHEASVAQAIGEGKIRGQDGTAIHFLWKDRSIECKQRNQSKDNLDNCQIFVNDLIRLITNRHLKEYFGQFGEILGIDRPKKSYCFITFSNPTSVDRVIEVGVIIGQGWKSWHLIKDKYIECQRKVKKRNFYLKGGKTSDDESDAKPAAPPKIKVETEQGRTVTEQDVYCYYCCTPSHSTKACRFLKEQRKKLIKWATERGRDTPRNPPNQPKDDIKQGESSKNRTSITKEPDKRSESVKPSSDDPHGSRTSSQETSGRGASKEERTRKDMSDKDRNRTRTSSSRQHKSSSRSRSRSSRSTRSRSLSHDKYARRHSRTRSRSTRSRSVSRDKHTHSRGDDKERHRSTNRGRSHDETLRCKYASMRGHSSSKCILCKNMKEDSLKSEKSRTTGKRDKENVVLDDEQFMHRRGGKTDKEISEKLKEIHEKFDDDNISDAADFIDFGDSDEGSENGDQNLEYDIVWIIGDNILNGAQVQAMETQKESFGLLPDRTQVHWFCYRGATLMNFMNNFQRWLQSNPPPTYIIIHLGTIDMATFDEDVNLVNINRALKLIRDKLPECTILWSEIIHRLSVNKGTSTELMAKKRESLNQFVITAVHEMANVYVIRHDFDYYRLFREGDSLHLMVLGLDKLLREFRLALQMVLKPNPTKCFPNCNGHNSPGSQCLFCSSLTHVAKDCTKDTLKITVKNTKASGDKDQPSPPQSREVTNQKLVKTYKRHGWLEDRHHPDTKKNATDTTSSQSSAKSSAASSTNSNSTKSSALKSKKGDNTKPSGNVNKAGEKSGGAGKKTTGAKSKSEQTNGAKAKTTSSDSAKSQKITPSSRPGADSSFSNNKSSSCESRRQRLTSDDIKSISSAVATAYGNDSPDSTDPPDTSISSSSESKVTKSATESSCAPTDDSAGTKPSNNCSNHGNSKPKTKSKSLSVTKSLDQESRSSGAAPQKKSSAVPKPKSSSDKGNEKSVDNPMTSHENAKSSKTSHVDQNNGKAIAKPIPSADSAKSSNTSTIGSTTSDTVCPEKTSSPGSKISTTTSQLTSKTQLSDANDQDSPGKSGDNDFKTSDPRPAEYDGHPSNLAPAVAISSTYPISKPKPGDSSSGKTSSLVGSENNKVDSVRSSVHDPIDHQTFSSTSINPAEQKTSLDVNANNLSNLANSKSILGSMTSSTCDKTSEGSSTKSTTNTSSYDATTVTSNQVGKSSQGVTNAHLHIPNTLQSSSPSKPPCKDDNPSSSASVSSIPNPISSSGIPQSSITSVLSIPSANSPSSLITPTTLTSEANTTSVKQSLNKTQAATASHTRNAAKDILSSKNSSSNTISEQSRVNSVNASGPASFWSFLNISDSMSSSNGSQRDEKILQRCPSESAAIPSRADGNHGDDKVNEPIGIQNPESSSGTSNAKASTSSGTLSKSNDNLAIPVPKPSSSLVQATDVVKPDQQTTNLSLSNAVITLTHNDTGSGEGKQEPTINKPGLAKPNHLDKPGLAQQNILHTVANPSKPPPNPSKPVVAQTIVTIPKVLTHQATSNKPALPAAIPGKPNVTLTKLTMPKPQNQASTDNDATPDTDPVLNIKISSPYSLGPTKRGDQTDLAKLDIPDTSANLVLGKASPSTTAAFHTRLSKPQQKTNQDSDLSSDKDPFLSIKISSPYTLQSEPFPDAPCRPQSLATKTFDPADEVVAPSNSDFYVVDSLSNRTLAEEQYEVNDTTSISSLKDNTNAVVGSPQNETLSTNVSCAEDFVPDSGQMGHEMSDDNISPDGHQMVPAAGAIMQMDSNNNNNNNTRAKDVAHNATTAPADWRFNDNEHGNSEEVSDIKRQTSSSDFATQYLDTGSTLVATEYGTKSEMVRMTTAPTHENVSASIGEQTSGHIPSDTYLEKVHENMTSSSNCEPTSETLASDTPLETVDAAIRNRGLRIPKKEWLNVKVALVPLSSGFVKHMLAADSMQSNDQNISNSSDKSSVAKVWNEPSTSKSAIDAHGVKKRKSGSKAKQQKARKTGKHSVPRTIATHNPANTEISKHTVAADITPVKEMDTVTATGDKDMAVFYDTAETGLSIEGIAGDISSVAEVVIETSARVANLGVGSVESRVEETGGTDWQPQDVSSVPTSEKSTTSKVAEEQEQNLPTTQRDQ